ncbi:AAEL014317-PA [Aedes aegypti]|uniref:AAEL014317-PA n=2 Tax=Aedes aegypti TaxID=7159 RepID=Q16GP0_AEDAE|nr:AAEL014317-PA [Aedes aegypti]
MGIHQFPKMANTSAGVIFQHRSSRRQRYSTWIYPQNRTGGFSGPHIRKPAERYREQEVFFYVGCVEITVGNRKGIDLPLGEMYCLQCLIPVLLIPKPTNPALMQTHVMFIVLYLIGFFLERKPCTICSLVFLAAVFLICNSGVGNCLFWGNCEGHTCDNG